MELSPASLERSLSLPVQSRMPAAPARATFPTPDSVPQASPGIAARFLPLLVDHPPPSKRLRSSQPYPAPAASARKCFLPFLWRPRVTARHTPLCCQPRAAGHALTCSAALTAPTVPYGAWLRLVQPPTRTPPPGSGPGPPVGGGATRSLRPRRAAILAPEHPALL